MTWSKSNELKYLDDDESSTWIPDLIQKEVLFSSPSWIHCVYCLSDFNYTVVHSLYSGYILNTSLSKQQFVINYWALQEQSQGYMKKGIFFFHVTKQYHTKTSLYLFVALSNLRIMKKAIECEEIKTFSSAVFYWFGRETLYQPCFDWLVCMLVSDVK